MAMARRAFVDKLPFITSFGHGEGGDHRARLGLRTLGPTEVITDLCVLNPDAASKELVVTSLHPRVSREDVVASCGWKVRFAADLAETSAPTDEELAVLRELQTRTERAHAGS
jgi:glutaconate CoA-transferase, subunit B